MEALIIRVLQGHATPQEEARLLEWRAAAPENERRFREVAEVWSVTGAGAPVRAVPPLPDVDAIVAAAEAPDAAEGRTRTVPLRRRRRAALLAIAAAVAIIAFGGALLSVGLIPIGGRSLGEVATGTGESVTLTLEDGTAIRVGPQSTLRLERRGSRQIAHLDGLAFFGVQRDPSRTFVVRTAAGEATVLGTRFEVRSEADHLQVMVIEGAVRVTAGGTSVDLVEGVLGESVAGGAPAARRIPDTEDRLAWMGRALVFQATPLERVLDEIAERYAARLILEDPSLEAVTVTASFTGRSLEEVVEVVCATVGAVCEIGGSNVRVGVRETARGAAD